MKTILTYKDEDLEQKNDQSVSSIEGTLRKEIGIAASDSEIDPNEIIDVVDNDFDAVLTENQRHFQTENRKLQAAIDDVEIGEEKRKIETEVKRVQQQRTGTEIDLERAEEHDEYNWDTFPVVLLALILVVLGDSLMNFRAFQLLQSTLIGALIIALIVAGMLGVAAHALGRKINETPDPKKKSRIFWTGMGASFLFFLFLGAMRSQFFGNDGSFLNSPVTWALWNSAFMAAATFISMRYMPSKRESQQHKQVSRYKRKRDALKKEENTLINQRKQLHQKHKELVQLHTALTVYEKDTIKHLYKQRDLLKARAWKEYALKGGTRKRSNPDPSSKQQLP